MVSFNGRAYFVRDKNLNCPIAEAFQWIHPPRKGGILWYRRGRQTSLYAIVRNRLTPVGKIRRVFRRWIFYPSHRVRWMIRMDEWWDSVILSLGFKIRWSFMIKVMRDTTNSSDGMQLESAIFHSHDENIFIVTFWKKYIWGRWIIQYQKLVSRTSSQFSTVDQWTATN